MTDYEKSLYCDSHPDCGCDCPNCEAFDLWRMEELGYINNQRYDDYE